MGHTIFPGLRRKGRGKKKTHYCFLFCFLTSWSCPLEAHHALFTRMFHNWSAITCPPASAVYKCNEIIHIRRLHTVRQLLYLWCNIAYLARVSSLSMAQHRLFGQGLLVIYGATSPIWPGSPRYLWRNIAHLARVSSLSRLHCQTLWDTSHSVGLLWKSDKPQAEISTWQHTTLTTDRHPCHRRDSNQQSQQACGCRPTP